MFNKVLKKIRALTIWLYYFFRFSVRQFYRQRGLQIASSLSYATLLAVVPLMTVMYSFLSGFPVFERMGELVENFIINNFVPAIGDTIHQYLRGFSERASQLTVTGISFLIVIALMLLATIDNALNVIWHVRVRRRPVARFLVYWAILTLGPLLVGTGIVVTTYVLSLSVISDVEATLGLNTKLLTYIPFLTSATAFTLLYILLPNCTVSHRHALVGGIIAAVMFEYSKYGFGIYVRSFTTYEDIFGAIAVIPIFLIWIYTSWVIVILGAHITFCMSAFRLSAEMMDKKGPDWTFTDACRVIRALWLAQKSGDALTVNGLRKSGVRIPHYQINEIMNALHESNWIQMDPKGGWLLSRDMAELTLMDLYRIIPNRIRLQSEGMFEGDETLRLNELMQTYNKNLNDLFSVPFKSIFPGEKEQK